MKDNKTKLYAGVAAAILAAAVAGFGAAKFTPSKTAIPPAEAETKAEPSDTVSMAADAIRSSGLVVEKVVEGGFSAEVLSQATVTPTPNGEARLTARASGAVIRISKRLGDPVRAGEVLAVVESREAAQIAAERTAASAKADLAQKTLERERRLFEARVSARQDLDAAEAEAIAAAAEVKRAQSAAAATHLATDGRSVVIMSPVAGRITAASVTLGSFVQPETELFRVADPSRVQIEATISGADAPRIAPGDRAVVDLPDGRSISGTVRTVTPGLDATTRSAIAVLDVPTNGLQPGQSVRARIIPKGKTASRAVVLPDDAVQTVDGRDVVFVQTDKGFKAQKVTLGQRGGGRVEIIGGLTAGQSAVTRNAFLLKAELSKGEGSDED